MSRTVSKKTSERLSIQGFGCYTDQELTDYRFGIRFAYVLCAVLAGVGIALTNSLILAVLMVIAGLAAILPNHPFDYFYNTVIRHLIGRPTLPPRSAQMRFACGVASIWLLLIILLFMTGFERAGQLLGIVPILVASLVSTTDICIPSIVYNLIKHRSIQPKP